MAQYVYSVHTINIIKIINTNIEYYIVKNIYIKYNCIGYIQCNYALIINIYILYIILFNLLRCKNTKKNQTNF